MNQTVILLYIVCKDKSEALKISQSALDAKLAACGNILDGMTSIYTWQGSRQIESEAVLILKTSPECKDACTELVKQVHSYETPCILSWESQAENPAYSAWIQDCLR